ncbi:cytochrome c family protein [Paeniroseomonas aquatica]|uniref:Cytochrome c family protein n=1 Tax=Paeniroseomonas aquatica TaxID=373043 RepID=A0ABT8A3E2_9PROT|nr:cytochrome c family protein [Paeniroseomonas aquatica]MDN3564183.1 cytochrome c family protein [Paeniroseomonas aquatica]
MRTTSVIIIAISAFLAIPFPSSVAFAQEAAAGQRVFNQCRACHTVELGGRNGVGPNLHGVFGRKAGSVEGFRYSSPMRQKGEQGLSWTEETLRPYLQNPREVVPGTNMAFNGIRNEQQLNDLIAYLKQATGASP